MEALNSGVSSIPEVYRRGGGSATISAVMKPQRREFLQALAAGAAALSIPRTSFGQTSSTTKLTEKATLVTGVGNNIVMFSSGGESLLVDCGDAAHAQAVVRLAGR